MAKLLTIQEAAKELGVNVKTIRRWEKAGKITAKRTAGGHRRFDLSELAEQAKENQRQYFSSLQVILSVITTLLATAFITNVAVARYADNNRQAILEQVVSSLNDPINKQFGIESNQGLENLSDAEDSETGESDLLTALGGEKLEDSNTEGPDTSALVPPVNKNVVASGISLLPADQNVAFVVYVKLVEGDVASVMPTSDASITLAVVDYVEGGGFLVTNLSESDGDVYFNWTVYR